MTHHRLRKFNTKKTYPEQKLDNDLCMSVRASGTHVFLRGQVGQDLQGRMVGIGDPAAQTEQAMKNVKTLLEEQGAELKDICKITVYLTDRAYREAVYRVVGKWLNHGADLYIFDEPTVGVDVGTKVEIYKLFAKLLKDGAGIILISSYLPEVYDLSDTLHVFRRGRLVASYDSAHVSEKAAHETANANVVTEAFYARDQAADAANDEVNLHPGLRG